MLTEGPSWENDKVGFRLYMDNRNGKDIWGKKTRAMMLDTIGTDPKNSYHEPSDWGMDIYKVGSSLSAGALALTLKLANGQDSLIRLGGKNMGKVIYSQICDGPLRARFELQYPKWTFAPGYPPISLTETISIWGGQYFYQSEVKMKGAPKSSSLVTGFANLYGLEFNQTKLGDKNVIFTYGKQSENKDNLGLAIIADNKEIASNDSVGKFGTDIKDSYILKFSPIKGDSKNTFQFMAAWSESSPKFKTFEGFKDYLDSQTRALDNPIRYHWSTFKRKSIR